MNVKLTISQAAKFIGFSIDTLRRLDKKGILKSLRTGNGGHRYYDKQDLINYLYRQDIFALAKKWVKNANAYEPIADYYCQDSYILQARLGKLENELGKTEDNHEIFPLLVAISGEIGNNSFDHNIGNWPDMPGIFFAWSTEKRMIVLADRGRGILATLKNVKPALRNDKDALWTAFTEVISGRAPENRGNGLKFVRDVVSNNDIALELQSGNAIIKINKKDMKIMPVKNKLRGCLALIKF